MTRPTARPLRTGFTTGACATAASKAAFQALLTGDFPDPVAIALPRGGEARFALAHRALRGAVAEAAVVKDAGDDPDVTHGAVVRASVCRLAPGAGIIFRAGEGVGTVTLPGLPLAVGEPAINPVPRRMMMAEIAALAATHGASADAEITIAIDDGARLAARTMNPRLGIVGGLSVLGTTGIVVPYSCAAWIHAIERGIDVARALCLPHVAGATGRTSEAAVQALYGLPDSALIDMGDFVGGMLKYLRRHPVGRVTIAGGAGKLAKLAAGALDLHSRRGAADPGFIAALAAAAGTAPSLCAVIKGAASVAQALGLAEGEAPRIAAAIAGRARAMALPLLASAATPVVLDVVVFDREGRLLGRAGP
jgi:cobalt-precorrin-5B (C1)-methyltransferase